MQRGTAAVIVFTCACFAARAQEKVPPPAAAAPARPPCGIHAPAEGWNAEAQFIAGMDGSKFTASLAPQQRAAWSYYARAGSADWKRVKAQYLDRIDDWRKTSLSSTTPGGVAFYPFSGPDAANVLRFFPDVREYVMIGLEPVGCIPAKPSDFAASYWPNLRQSLQSVVAMGFFKTDDMRKDFSADGVEGVLPALLFLVSRSGYAVTDVVPVMVGADGKLIPAGGPVKPEARGVTIKFEDEKHTPRALTYLSVNLHDSSLKRKPGTLQYLSSLPKPVTLVKSASYLMHKKYFSSIREVILTHSAAIVEDDSGIPFKFFDKAVWDVHLYGHYTKPIEMFNTWYQDDLKSAFSAPGSAQTLEFGIGYKYRANASTLILARRRG